MNIKKHYLFSKELKYIQDVNKRRFCEICLDGLPDYFWEIPASSTGKHHPSYTIGQGGLSRHVQACMRIAVELFKCGACFNLTQEDKDNVLVALSLHDGFKSGSNEDYIQNKHTKHNHPLLAGQYVLQMQSEYEKLITKEDAVIIAQMINSHMGNWNESKYSDIILPVPKDEIQKFVHLCDYLASRKCLELNFDATLSY